jgi:hypothetical protein
MLAKYFFVLLDADKKGNVKRIREGIGTCAKIWEKDWQAIDVNKPKKFRVEEMAKFL